MSPGAPSDLLWGVLGAWSAGTREIVGPSDARSHDHVVFIATIATLTLVYDTRSHPAYGLGPEDGRGSAGACLLFNKFRCFCVKRFYPTLGYECKLTPQTNGT